MHNHAPIFLNIFIYDPYMQKINQESLSIYLGLGGPSSLYYTSFNMNQILGDAIPLRQTAACLKH